ncbi:MAG: bifunctional oligoribonuclease/PAP phosphatase NrnA [Mariprofundus sp.]
MNTSMQPLISDVDWRPVIDAIEQAEHIMLITHCNPDGDGIGAQQALYDLLVASGKKVRMHNRDGVPRIYHFLAHAGKVSQGDWAQSQDADLIIALDCGAFGRLGMPESFFAGATLLNIDHHASNKRFGDINLVEARYCATGAMIFDLMLAMQAPLSEASATAIYTAVMTDTACFRLASATPAVYHMAAALIEAGAKPWPITVQVYESRSLAGMQMMTACLSTLEIKNDGRSAWIYVNQEIYSQTGADVEDTEGLIDYARSIDGVEIAVFIRVDEHDSHRWKVSFRGKTWANVGDLAASLGGGGHAYAAGCILQGSLQEVCGKIEQAVDRVFE